MAGLPIGAGRIGAWWSQWSLATRFAVASGVVLVLAALGIGSWVAARIEDTVVRNSANATAIYMESFLSPISQQLAETDGVSPGARRALEEIFTNTPLGDRIVSFKIWSRDGVVLEASNPEIVGQTFPMTDDLRRAWNGEVVAHFDRLGDAEDAAEVALGLPITEIYSPIHQVWSGDVLAVAEFYEVNAALEVDLRAARLAAWGAVTGIVLGLGSVLYAIVLGGSRTIEAQRRDLDQQVADLADLSGRNTELRLRVQGAAARTAEQTDLTMRRIGADLHDGAAQYLAYAALRLDNLRDRIDAGPATAELDAVKDAVGHAMTEVRTLARGLSLPELKDRPLSAIHRAAAEAHEVRTGHDVTVTIDCPDDLQVTQALRICLFRFVQEGLNNASRHGGGIGLGVTLTFGAGVLRAIVRDHGPGLAHEQSSDGLGLSGLRDRVESLSGTFSIRTHPDGGTELSMTIEGLAA
jgi:signal transduction histidine kinase